MKISILAYGLSIGFLLQGLVEPATASSLRETPLVKAVQSAQRAVINIHTEKTSEESNSVFGTTKRGKINGMGTGIVIDERGYVVTNNHVIAGVDSLEVSLVDGSRFPAHVVAFDRKHDLAIIKIDGDPSLEVMRIGTSTDLMLGETVIAVGNAYGYVHTVTSGIISSLSRDVEVNEEQQYKNLIQTDASINPGNSGGPLLNLDGEVIGINVAIRAGAQRIGFAIPIDDARTLIARLISIEVLDGKYHGLETRDIKNTDLQQLQVESVKTGSPGAQAGLQVGDIILQVNNQGVQDRVDLERALLGRSLTESIPVVVLREEVEEELTLKLSSTTRSQYAHGVELPSSKANPVSYEKGGIWEILGLKLEELPENQRSRVGPRYRGGMQVVAVRPESPASANGIRRGDVLVGLHVWETVNNENVSFVIEHPQLKTFSPLKFFILRNGETLYGHLNIQAGVRTP
ncbi:MAG: trypsin-like peptidase domain-containing protein [Planctomycetaceae bacterium]|nr:trypsin-like peptidase domain-containing protein [Planctomycetaceae bacterium]